MTTKEKGKVCTTCGKGNKQEPEYDSCTFDIMETKEKYCPRCIESYDDVDGLRRIGTIVKSVCEDCLVCKNCEHLLDCQHSK